MATKRIGGPDQFWYGRIAMFPREIVTMLLERKDEIVVLELARQLQPSFVAGILIQVDHDFVHAADLGVHHVLELVFIEVGKNPPCPFPERDFHFQGGAVAGVAIRIAQTAEHLVERVPGGPQAVEIERSGLYFARARGATGIPSALQRRQVAVAMLVLNDFQFPDE